MSHNLTIASCEQRLRLSYRPGGDFPDFVTRYGRTIHVHSVFPAGWEAPADTVPA